MDLSKLTFVDFSSNKLKYISVEFGEFLVTLAAFEIEKNPWASLELQQLNGGISLEDSKAIINNYLQSAKEKSEYVASIKEPKKKTSILSSPSIGFLKKRPPSGKGGEHRDIASTVSEGKDESDSEASKAKKDVKPTSSIKNKDHEAQMPEAPVLPLKPSNSLSAKGSPKPTSASNHNTPIRKNIEEVHSPTNDIDEGPIPERSGAQLKKIGRAAGPKGRKPPTVEFVVKNAEKEDESKLQPQIEIHHVGSTKKEADEKPTPKHVRGSSEMLNDDSNTGSSTVSKKKGIFGFGGDKNKAGHQLADLFKHNPKAVPDEQETKKNDTLTVDSEPPVIPSKATKPYRPPSTDERVIGQKSSKNKHGGENADSSLKNSKNGSVEEKLDQLAKEEPKKEILVPKKNPLMAELAEHSLKSTKAPEKDQSKEDPKKEILLPKKNPIAAEISELPPKPQRNKAAEPEQQKEEPKKEIIIPKKGVPVIPTDAEVPLRPTKSKEAASQQKEEEGKKEILLPKKNIVTPTTAPIEAPTKLQRNKPTESDPVSKEDPQNAKKTADNESPAKTLKNKVPEESPLQPGFPAKVVLGGGSMRMPKPSAAHAMPSFAPIDDKAETAGESKPIAPQINIAELKNKQIALENSKNAFSENTEIEQIDISPIKRRPAKPSSEARDASKVQSMYETSTVPKREAEPASNSLYDESNSIKPAGVKPAFDLSEMKLKQNNLRKTEPEKEIEAPTLPAKAGKPLAAKQTPNESTDVPPRPAKAAFDKQTDPALPPKPKIVQQQESAPIPPWKAELEKRKQNSNQVQ
ncbi:hypothetical protein HK103_004774 [Boothiomyces macroporosus]|uniref:Uncharacterized protein n=1 Tax=Boothiomyces macroporosus TaxID=261099 RepID=A0AAD5Y695_9FUNG|nr:hypothetical protein HK103_004774 [Boothiomyces macroporosus]